MRVQLTVFPEVTKERTAVVEAASSQQVLLVAISLAKPTLNSDVQKTWPLEQVDIKCIPKLRCLTELGFGLQDPHRG